MQKEWQGYIEEILDAKKSYTDTERTVMYEKKLMVAKTVRNEDQIVSWIEDDIGDIVNVVRTFK